MRFEIKTTRGYIVVEDASKDTVNIWFAEGGEVAIARERGKLQALGETQKSALRRLGRGI